MTALDRRTQIYMVAEGERMVDERAENSEDTSWQSFSISIVVASKAVAFSARSRGFPHLHSADYQLAAGMLPKDQEPKLGCYSYSHRCTCEHCAKKVQNSREEYMCGGSCGEVERKELVKGNTPRTREKK